jgi:hypothetical protein
MHDKARRLLDQINVAPTLDMLRIPPSNRLEKLKGDRAGFWSLRINERGTQDRPRVLVESAARLGSLARQGFTPESAAAEKDGLGLHPRRRRARLSGGRALSSASGFSFRTASTVGRCPTLRTIDSSPSNSNPRGMRGAWLLPLRNRRTWRSICFIRRFTGMHTTAWKPLYCIGPSTTTPRVR